MKAFLFRLQALGLLTLTPMPFNLSQSTIFLPPLLTGFDQRQRIDLDEAVSLQIQGVDLLPPLHPSLEIDPELADKLREIATALELGSHRGFFCRDFSTTRTSYPYIRRHPRLSRLNEDWGEI